MALSEHAAEHEVISAADPRHVWLTSEDRSPGDTTLYTSDDGGVSWHKLDLTTLH
jgi:Neuraminidase (sialidase)